VTAWLIDTNVLSELRKGARIHPNVLRWAESTLKDQHFISVLSLGEIRRGIELLRRRSPDQCPAFERWLGRLQADYDRAILPISEDVADRWGHLMALRTLPVIDGLLAATALVHGLTIATHNTGDFLVPGLSTVDPFS
jgi:predicted nucleic acid-binding protein